MNIAITGSTGLVGSAVIPLLSSEGHTMVPMVRSQSANKPSASEFERTIAWDPLSDSLDPQQFEGIDAVVHLAGENIAESRWNDEMKSKIYKSRVDATRHLCEALAKMEHPPKILVVASAIGFYGNRGDDILDESKPAGQGFLADVVKDWESAAAPAYDAGIRVVQLRFGVVLSPKSGALAKMLTPFKFGVGGKIGSGEQYWSWVSIDDAAGMICHALSTDALQGPVNAVAPEPMTNSAFTKTLGRVLHRPTIFPMPAFAAKLALGEMAEDLLLSSTRVDPKKLKETGYQFRAPSLEKALRDLLGK